MNRRLFIRGDMHGNFDFLPDFCEENETTFDDILIILGDAGILYYGANNWREIYTKDFIAECPITLFCIRGNHEARPTDRNTKLINVGIGDDVYIEPKYPNIWYAVDGGVYEICGKNILTIGGAYSVDKEYRLMMNWHWFENEQLDEDERSLIFDFLGECFETHFHFDYVLTHTCPFTWMPTDLFIRGINQSTVDNTMEHWLEKITRIIDFDHWYFGHFHANRKDVCGDGKVHMLFDEIVQIV